MAPAACEGYDQINYDEDVYDCEGATELNILLSFAWGLEPLPEENCDMAQVAYSLNLQGTDNANLITTQADVSDAVPLSNNVLSDDTYNIPAGAIDFPLHVIDTDIDVLAVIPSSGVITVKVNELTGTPFNVKKLLFVDGQGISAVYVSNPGSSAIRVRAIMAARD